MFGCVLLRRWRSFWVCFCLFPRKERERIFLSAVKKKKKRVVFFCKCICRNGWAFSLYLFGLLLFSITATLFTSPTAARLPEVCLYSHASISSQHRSKARRLQHPGTAACPGALGRRSPPPKNCCAADPERVTLSHMWPVHKTPHFHGDSYLSMGKGSKTSLTHCRNLSYSTHQHVRFFAAVSPVPLQP